MPSPQPAWLAPFDPQPVWDDEPWPWAFWDDDDRRPVYFAFVEDMGLLTNLDGLDAPDGQPLSALPDGVTGQPSRFRMAAIRAQAFIDIIGEFDELDPETVT